MGAKWNDASFRTALRKAVRRPSKSRWHFGNTHLFIRRACCSRKNTGSRGFIGVDSKAVLPLDRSKASVTPVTRSRRREGL